MEEEPLVAPCCGSGEGEGDVGVICRGFPAAEAIMIATLCGWGTDKSKAAAGCGCGFEH